MDEFDLSTTLFNLNLIEKEIKHTQRSLIEMRQTLIKIVDEEDLQRVHKCIEIGVREITELLSIVKYKELELYNSYNGDEIIECE